MKNTKRFKTIDQYIKAFPAETGKRLEVIRKIVKERAPEAVETISYNMPAFKQNGVLIYFAAHKHHIGLYPFPPTLNKFKKEAASYKTAKGSIQFPFDKKLPIGLIAKIVAHRVNENMENNKEKGSGKTSSHKGSHTLYHKDGSLWAKGSKTSGKMESYWEWFRKDGTKMRSGYFTKGEQTGIWTTYDAKGKIHKITEIKKVTMCSRGHAFTKTSTRPVCPQCWPGYYKNKK